MIERRRPPRIETEVGLIEGVPRRDHVDRIADARTDEQRTGGGERGSAEALDDLVRSERALREEEVLLRVDRRLDANAPAIAVAGRAAHVVVVVVEMHLPEAHAWDALPDLLEGVVMQRHAQLGAIRRRG